MLLVLAALAAPDVQHLPLRYPIPRCFDPLVGPRPLFDPVGVLQPPHSVCFLICDAVLQVTVADPGLGHFCRHLGIQ